jgi:hypothetical protein
VAEHSCLQPGKPVAETDSSSRHFRLVLDQPAAAVSEDGRSTGKTCAVLLDGVGRRTSDANTVLGNVAQDCAVAASGKLATDRNTANPNHGGQWRMDRCRRN